MRQEGKLGPIMEGFCVAQERQEGQPMGKKISGHTPGPWTIRPCACGCPNWNVEPILGYRESSVSKPDAHLIAAAPALLAACQEAQEALDVLAEDAEEAGYPERAESATKLAMKLRQVAAAAEGRAG